MPFFKKEIDRVSSSPIVTSPNFQLVEENHEAHTYPVDGWYWFANLDAAISFFTLNPTAENMVVTPRQFRRALIQAGLLDDVEAFMASATPEIRTDWEYAVEIRRDYPGWDAIAAMMGKTPADIDAIFSLASTII